MFLKALYLPLSFALPVPLAGRMFGMLYRRVVQICTFGGVQKMRVALGAVFDVLPLGTSLMARCYIMCLLASRSRLLGTG